MQIESQPIPAHVESVEDGIRNIDVIKDFPDHVELTDYVIKCALCGVGGNAITLKAFDRPESVIRIEYENFAGYQWTEQLLVYLIEVHKQTSTSLECISSMDNLLLKLRKIDQSSFFSKHRKHNMRREFKQRIAAHNSQYRRDPLSTIPVNGYYAFKGEPLALHLKHLDGKSLKHTNSEASMTPAERVILADPNLVNILVSISNSLSQRQFIDLYKFRASNLEI
jgi:hypothetical protein